MAKFFEIFDKPAQEYYQKMITLADVSISQIEEPELSNESIHRKAEEIFELHFVYPTLEIYEELKEMEVKEVSQAKYKKLVPESNPSSNLENEVVAELIYDINYSGWQEALNYTVNLPKRKVRGELSRAGITQTLGTIRVIYYVPGTQIDAYGVHVRIDKEELVNSIKTNCLDLSKYFESKREDFFTYILTSLNNRLTKNRIYAETLNKF